MNEGIQKKSLKVGIIEKLLNIIFVLIIPLMKIINIVLIAINLIANLSKYFRLI